MNQSQVTEYVASASKPNTNTNIIEARNLVKQYDAPNGTTAVNGISFDIPRGQIFSLLGPNGAGKSTTISMLSCLMPPTSGDAMVAGYSVTKDSKAVREHIGVVPQEIALYENLTAAENLHFWGQMYGLSGPALRTRVDEILDLIGLKDKARQRVSTYSGGMKRRVNIGVGLLHRPDIVFMDEPTVGVDPQSRRNILDNIKQLNKDGMSVLYTTHYMEEAQEISDEIAIVDHGQIIAKGTQQELINKVGEKTIIEIVIDEGSLQGRLIDSPAINAMRDLDGISHVKVDGNKIQSLCLDAGAMLAPLLGTASRHHLVVKNVAVNEPNLEMVFLHLTGRALRD